MCSPQIHLNDAGYSDLSSRVCFVFFPQEFVKLICFTTTLSRLSWEEKGLCQPTNKSSASTETTFATLLMQIGFWLCHLPHAIVWALKIVTSMPAAKSRQPETCAGSHILLFLHRTYIYICILYYIYIHLYWNIRDEQNLQSCGQTNGQFHTVLWLGGRTGWCKSGGCAICRKLCWSQAGLWGCGERSGCRVRKSLIPNPNVHVELWSKSTYLVMENHHF